eukprot:gene29896-36101_t
MDHHIQEINNGRCKMIVVFISGFLTPNTWQSYPGDLVPNDMEIISVFPSPTGSLHDRVCQTFYELKGGTVDYGDEHSAYHGHERFGRSYPGLYADWDENHPIYLIGHSFGGLTAWALQNYLAMNIFPGFKTNAAWIAGVVCVNTPFNSALRVYNQGMHMQAAPMVRWLSPGYFIGLLVHLFEFIDSPLLKKIMDFDQNLWKLSHQNQYSLYYLLLSFLGAGLYSGIDTLSYDATLQSMLCYQQLLETYREGLYLAVVGDIHCQADCSVPLESTRSPSPTSTPQHPSNSSNRATPPPSASPIKQHVHKSPSLLLRAYRLLDQVRSKYRGRIAGRDTTPWVGKLGERVGGDGLLSTYTQLAPTLHSHGSRGQRLRDVEQLKEVWREEDGRGRWHSLTLPLTHLTPSFQCRATWSALLQAVRLMHRAGSWHKTKCSSEEYVARVKRQMDRWHGGCGCRPDLQSPHALTPAYLPFQTYPQPHYSRLLAFLAVFSTSLLFIVNTSVAASDVSSGALPEMSVVLPVVVFLPPVLHLIQFAAPPRRGLVQRMVFVVLIGYLESCFLSFHHSNFLHFVGAAFAAAAGLGLELRGVWMKAEGERRDYVYFFHLAFALLLSPHLFNTQLDLIAMRLSAPALLLVSGQVSMFLSLMASLLSSFHCSTWVIMVIGSAMCLIGSGTCYSLLTSPLPYYLQIPLCAMCFALFRAMYDPVAYTLQYLYLSERYSKPNFAR